MTSIVGRAVVKWLEDGKMVEGGDDGTVVEARTEDAKGRRAFVFAKWKTACSKG